MTLGELLLAEENAWAEEDHAHHAIQELDYAEKGDRLRKRWSANYVRVPSSPITEDGQMRLSIKKADIDEEELDSWLKVPG